ncbi:MAG: GNAT family N-acetyltransferase [Nocardioides sp.]
MSALVIRPLGTADRDRSVAIDEEAFGSWPGGLPAAPPVWPPDGTHVVGTFDGDELLAKLNGREYHSWFGGAEIPTWGIAGVAVAAEHRGRRLLGDLFAASFVEAQARGMAVSTLFFTAARVYRSVGFELVGGFEKLHLPTSALTAVQPTEGIRLRRAVPGDGAAIHAVYTAWASRQNGPLTRTGPNFPDGADRITERYTGVTVALDAADDVVGYVSWNRGSGYNDSARIDVGDLIATTPAATRALLRMLGSFAIVTGNVVLRTSRPDLVHLALPGLPPPPVESWPYMLRVLDLPAAVEPRHYPPALDTSVGFTVTGDAFGDLDGGWRIVLKDGTARCERDSDVDGPTLAVGGLSVLYAGAMRVSQLRLAGLVTGGDPERDADLDAVFVGPGFHIRDYF